MKELVFELVGSSSFEQMLPWSWRQRLKKEAFMMKELVFKLVGSLVVAKPVAGAM